MKICKVDGCNCKVHAKGYCDRHYRQFKKHGKIIIGKKDNNEIVFYKDYIEIILCDKNSNEIGRAIVDLEDLELIKKYKWCMNKDGYVIGSRNNKNVLLHRLVTNCSKDKVVDHINHNCLDNRKKNLRICDKQKNAFNQTVNRKNNTSGTIGVIWNKQHNKWEARIKVNYKMIHLGLFNNKDDAIKSRKLAEIKYFGEYRYKESDN